MTHQVLAYGVSNRPTVDIRAKSKPAVDWIHHLPRSIVEVLSMPESNPDRAGFLASLRYMETWDPAEELIAEQMQISGIGMSRCVFTKKYHPDGTFDKNKCRIVFRGDR